MPAEIKGKEHIISFNKANLYSFLLILPILLIYIGPYFLFWGIDEVKNIFSPDISFIAFLIFFLAALLGIVVHELIHGLFWAIKAQKGWKAIKFGVNWKALAPYAHCKEALPAKDYILGAIMPGVLLGIMPAIIAIIIGNTFLLIYGIIFTIAAGGDLIYFIMLLKLKGNPQIQDHPEKVGFVVLEEE